MVFGLLCVLAACAIVAVVVAPTIKHVMKRND
jgi:hypothetical protein